MAIALAVPTLITAAPADKSKSKQKTAQPAAPKNQAQAKNQAPAKAVVASATKPGSAGVAFFERKIRPVLVEQCYNCHSTTGEKIKANLLSDSREALLKGGDSGPAIVPGNPGKSLLIKAMKWTDEDLQMPPKTQLPPAVVADFEQWVKMGAPWPAERKQDVASSQTQAERWADLKSSHWAWQPVESPKPPAVQDSSWPRSDIDRFILAALEEKGLKPVGDADRVTLIRRVTFDLTGLPPRPEEIIAFANDKSPNAFEKVVDRLLASPQFGERWGRHWLDVARYSESTGSTRNYPYQPAWRYRDYVIDSFNADKPYDQFVTEQLAGDLMPAKDASQRNERIIATGYLAMGVKDLNERDRDKFVMDNVDEQIDTVSRSILASTIACARCHDHKFDPIPTSEYYQLAGIFRSTEILAGVTSKGGKAKYTDPNAYMRLMPEDQPAADGRTAGKKDDKNDKRIAAVQAKLDDAQKDVRKLMADLGIEPGDKAAAKKIAKQSPAKARQMQALRQEMQSLRAELEDLESGKAPAATAGKNAGPTAIGVSDVAKPADCRINIRGDHDNLGDSVPRGFISLFESSSVPPIKPDESGRLQLAAWMTSRDNPLTSRVMANRVWHHLFGAGLVRTVDNFGTTGEAPSHPELLDHLATQFMKDGWSVKKLIRSLVLSRTYQLGSTYITANYDADPANTLLWRHSLRRLDAEEIRDAMLFAGQSLDLNRPAGSPVASAPVAEFRIGRRNAVLDRDIGNHRSVYMPVVRALVDPMLEAFDFAEPTMVTGDRDVTTVAPQALFMMNNEFTVEQSRRLAEKLLNDSSIGDDSIRIDHAYGWTLGRSATAAERARVTQYLNDFVAEVGGKPEEARTAAWASLVQALIASAEFRYVQ